jgi:DNA polymerase III epsilon subunit-like protein
MNNKICVFDYETGGTNVQICPVLSIGAVIIDEKSLQIIDEFYSLVKPDDFSTINEDALKVNKLTIAELQTAVPEKIVWQDFVTFINKHKNGTSMWNSPIASGFNISSFDMIITDGLCKKYGPYDKKEGRAKLFRPFPQLDLSQIIFSWFMEEKEPKKLNLSAIASYLGFSQEVLDNCHNSLGDSKVTAQILIRFLKFQRNIMGQYRDKIKGCFDGKSM